MAGGVGGEGHLPRPRGHFPAQALRPGHVPLHLRRPPRRPLVQLRHRRRPRPLQADAGLQRLRADRLRRLRPAGRERRHQARHQPLRLDPAQHREHDPPAEDHRHHVRLEPDAGHLPARSTTGGTSGSSCSSTSSGLAYRAKAPANWCPHCQTTLANEQVEDGLCWRCGTPVTRRDLEQWFFKITAYADELLDFSEIEWPERVVTMQRNWIGRSEGVEFTHAGGGLGRLLRRLHHPPRHHLRHHLRGAGAGAPAGGQADDARAPAGGGRPTSSRPAARARSSVCPPRRRRPASSSAPTPSTRSTGEQVPIWIADYVLGTYGTGAIMAVPAHDERDFEFAKKFGLPIRR